MSSTQPSDSPRVPTTEQKPEQKSSEGSGVLGALSSGMTTAGNTIGIAAGGILSTAGETFNTAAKGTGDTLQKTIGAVTGGNGGAGQQGK